METPDSKSENLDPNLARGSHFDLPKGTLIDGRFQIDELIAERSTTGSIYSGKHLLLDRKIALKFLHSNSKESHARFHREAQALAQLEHTHIAKVFGFGCFETMPYVSVEFVQGQTLAELLKQKTRFTAAEAFPLFHQLLDALEHAHENGVIHRKLCPSNILIESQTGSVKLIDFGLGKLCSKRSEQMNSQTDELGEDLRYSSPEQTKGLPADASSDLYAAACLMFQVLDGRIYSEVQKINQSNKSMSNSRLISPYLDTEKGAVILSALSPSPDQRPRSALEFSEALLNPQWHSLNKDCYADKKWKRLLLAVCSIILLAAIALTQRVTGTVATKPASDTNNSVTATKILSSKTNPAPINATISLRERVHRRALTTVDQLKLARAQYHIGLTQENYKNALPHYKAAIEYYQDALKGTYAENKPTLATLRVRSAISETAMAYFGTQKQHLVEPDPKISQLVRSSAEIVCSMDPEQLPFLPDGLVIPEGSLNSTIDCISVSHTILASLYLTDPTISGLADDAAALEHCNKAIEISENGNLLELAYAERAKAFLLAKQGKISEAEQEIRDVQHRLILTDADRFTREKIEEIILRSREEIARVGVAPGNSHIKTK